MKLQKQLSRRVGNKKYPKYVIAVPPKYIEELGWKEGEELMGDILEDKLVIKRVKATSS